jgi:hypothetical protein
MTVTPSPNRTAMGSLTLLVTWEVWNKRNARVFHNKQFVMVILDKIKKEAKLWVSAWAKRVGEVIWRKSNPFVSTLQSAFCV